MFHQKLDQVLGLGVVHIGPDVELIDATAGRRIFRHGLGNAHGMREVARAEHGRFARAEIRSGGAREDGLARLLGFVEASLVILERQAAILKDDHVRAGGDESFYQIAGLLRGLGRAARREGRLEAGVFVGARNDLRHRGEGARADEFAVQDGVAMRRADLSGIADADGGGDAEVQHRLGVIPVVDGLRVPKAGEDELAVGFDYLRAGRVGGLTLARNAGDAIALDDHDGVAHGRAAVAVDQRAALDDEGGGSWRWRLGLRLGRDAGSDCANCANESEENDRDETGRSGQAGQDFFSWAPAHGTHKRTARCRSRDYELERGRRASGILGALGGGRPRARRVHNQEWLCH